MQIDWLPENTGASQFPFHLVSTHSTDSGIFLGELLFLGGSNSSTHQMFRLRSLVIDCPESSADNRQQERPHEH
jgi:hypothetical protein